MAISSNDVLLFCCFFFFHSFFPFFKKNNLEFFLAVMMWGEQWTVVMQHAISCHLQTANLGQLILAVWYFGIGVTLIFNQVLELEKQNKMFNINWCRGIVGYYVSLRPLFFNFKLQLLCFPLTHFLKLLNFLCYGD